MTVDLTKEEMSILEEIWTAAQVALSEGENWKERLKKATDRFGDLMTDKDIF